MLGIVVGLLAEARIAHRLSDAVEAGGGSADGALQAATRLAANGADSLLSFGLAGGLMPGLKAGAILIPASLVDDGGRRWTIDSDLAKRLGKPQGCMLAADDVLVTSAEKRAAWDSTGALGADIESGAVARVAAEYNIRFAVLRAVCDPAERSLPPAALTALNAQGGIQVLALIRSVASQPRQIPQLISLGREASRARSALLARVETIGPIK